MRFIRFIASRRRVLRHKMFERKIARLRRQHFTNALREKWGLS